MLVLYREVITCDLLFFVGVIADNPWEYIALSLMSSGIVGNVSAVLALVGDGSDAA